MTHHSSPATNPATNPEPTSEPAGDTDPLFYVCLLVPVGTTAARAVVAWAKSKGKTRREAAVFNNRLADQHLVVEEAGKLLATIDLLSETEQALAIKLVTDGAFTRRELRDPKQITAYFARPDWMEIVATWRASPLPTIEQVIQGIEAAQRQKEKLTTAPLPIIPGSGRGNRDSLTRHLKAVLPRPLRGWATDLTEAVRTLAEDPLASMDATALATAVKLRRPGTGTKVCGRVIASGLPHLVEHGYVIVEDGKARIHPGALV